MQARRLSRPSRLALPRWTIAGMTRLIKLSVTPRRACKRSGSAIPDMAYELPARSCMAALAVGNAALEETLEAGG